MLKFGTMSFTDARLLNPLQLAYIGDCVWEILIRSMLIAKKYNVNHMHRTAVRYVNASAQAGALRIITSLLTDDELDIVQRGRNCHTKHPVPKNQNPDDYAYATSFEALIGYLYLTGCEERISFLFDQIIMEDHTDA